MADITPRSAQRQHERSVKLGCNATPDFDTNCASLLGLHADSGLGRDMPTFSISRVSPIEARATQFVDSVGRARRFVSWAASGIVTADG